MLGAENFIGQVTEVYIRIGQQAARKHLLSGLPSPQKTKGKNCMDEYYVYLC